MLLKLTDEARHHAVPVLIGDLLEGPSGVSNGGGAALIHLQQVESVLDRVSDGLSVGRGAGPEV